MVANAARRVREGLAELIRAANDPATSTEDLRVLLVECKAYGGQLAVLQADSAAGIAGRESHGDGGVGVLAQTAGVSRREAASHVKTAEKLESLPSVRDAVESGKISVANARVLAGASEKTSAEQVERDEGLLSQAAVLSPEQFAREARRWAARRQPDDGEERYRRQRAQRRLSIFDGDDGMVLVRGELDPVTGAKVRKRFLQEAERLRRLDLHSPGADKRTLNQRMADALDTLTSHGSIYARIDHATSEAADGKGAAGNGEDVGEPDGNWQRSDPVSALPAANSRPTRGADRSTGTDSGPGGGTSGGGAAGRGKCGCGSKPSADITIVQHLDAAGTAGVRGDCRGRGDPPERA